MVTEITEALDFVSFAVSIFLGVIITSKVEHVVSTYLASSRGKSVLGGELFLYAIVLAGSIFFGFQILSKLLKWLRDN